MSVVGCGSSGSGGSAPQSFCDDARAALTQLQSLDYSKPATFAPIAATFNALRGKAPAELKDDLKTVADAAAGYANGTIPDQTRLVPAITHVQSYASDTCHITAPGATTPSSS